MTTGSDPETKVAMSIGGLAQAAGIGVETVRYYQRIGLLPAPSIPAGGRRKYSMVALQQIAFIKRAQNLGFTLDEIKALMKLRDGSRCQEAKAYAVRKLEELHMRVSELKRMIGSLDDLSRQCEANTRGAPCPFIEALNHGLASSDGRKPIPGGAKGK
jgi:MerR family mercuric resistance operon transcriptional regulator